ncbi:MAG: preprotein translocase subunit SecG [Planctomycetota bacterium]
MNRLLNPTQLLAVAGGPGWLEWLLSIGFVAICIIMMLIILIQKPKGGGLSGAFGGGAGGGSERSFVGARAGDVLTWLTVGCFLAFLLLAMGLTWQISPRNFAEEDPQAQTTEETGGAGQAPASEE